MNHLYFLKQTAARSFKIPTWIQIKNVFIICLLLFIFPDTGNHVTTEKFKGFSASVKFNLLPGINLEG